jgi:plastocyanin
MMLKSSTMMSRREALVAIGAGTLAACTSDRPTGPGNGNADATVNMTDQFTFSPVTVNIRVGQTVRWTNPSAFAHTATGDPAKANDPSHVSLPAGVAAWDSGPIAAGGSFNKRFDVAGQYLYFCIPHEGQGMLGTIIVAP